MPSTYAARIRGDRLEWVGGTPKEIAESATMEVWITVVGPDRGHTKGAPEPATGISRVEDDEIGRLYNEIAALSAHDREGGSAADERLEAVWTRLRELQSLEAQRHHEAFEASLAMPIDAGARILGMVEALRRELATLEILAAG